MADDVAEHAMPFTPAVLRFFDARCRLTPNLAVGEQIHLVICDCVGVRSPAMGCRHEEAMFYSGFRGSSAGFGC